jgi:SAM-dependent methyltransferase
LTRTILEAADPRSVAGVEPSHGYVAYARHHVSDDRVRFEVGDAESLPFDTGGFDAVVSGLVLNFVPNPGQAAAEMKRVARPGGTVAAYVWDYAGKMELMRFFWDAAVALNPEARDLDEGRRFPVCRPEPLRDLFTEAGLRESEVRAIQVPTHFQDFDDYWPPFLGGQGPAPGYAMSLTEAQRTDLREYIRHALPAEPDGSICLVAQAWAVRGTR